MHRGPSALKLTAFNYRSYLPIPFVVAAILLMDPTPLSFICGVVIALAGSLLRLWALLHIGPKTRSSKKMRADELVTTGPFAYIRNPLYFGNGLLCIGAAVAAGTYWLLLLLPLLFLFWSRLIIPGEEAFLRGMFGAPFDAYCAEVCRFLPRRTPYRRGAPAFTLAEVLPGELNTIVAAQLVLIAIGWQWLS